MRVRLRWAAPQALAAILCFCVPASAAEDVYKAFRPLEAQALAGDLDAMVTIAAAYRNAEGLPRDPEMAVRLYCTAAQGGHPAATYAVGWAYANGYVLKRNDDQAAAWFRLAAARGAEAAVGMLKLIKGRAPDAKPFCPFNPPRLLLRVTVPAKIAEMVQRLAPKHRLDPGLVLAVIKVESDFQTRAVSTANAQGLMQLIPETAKRFGVKDSFDEEQNLIGGMKYLRWLLDRFDGNLELTLAAYNAGENAVDKYNGVPPYPETREYVKRLKALGAIPAARTGAREESRNQQQPRGLRIPGLQCSASHCTANRG
jgi:soluble lytic murein transglycosylase-like protein